MKIRLMDENGYWNPSQKLPFGASAVQTDLMLSDVFAEMAQGDAIIYSAVRTAILSPLTKKKQILYRQQVLIDCINNNETVCKLYKMTLSALAKQESPDLRFGEMQSVSNQFNRCLSRLTDLTSRLHSLRDFARTQEENFCSQGFQSLFYDLNENLDDKFFKGLNDLIWQLQFTDGMLIGSKLSESGYSFGNELLRVELKAGINPKDTSFYEVDEDDLKGLSDLVHRKELAMSSSNRILVRAVSFVCSYLQSLKNNLAFYVGCLNLYQNLTSRKIILCMPTISSQKYQWSAVAITELQVALKEDHPISNDLKMLNGCCVITGADFGGKTTFLRAVGQSHLMMQCGMFVLASFFCAPVMSGIFTHFQRQEDTSLLNGKLGEELTRMSGIISYISPHALILCDESFCSTNEHEGSEISWQITQALRKNEISVFTVTALFQFAQRLYTDCREDCTFLCPERLWDGTRTKRILPGAPQAIFI